MPIYEYQCEACGHEIEVLQAISEPLLQDCPSCGKPALRKLVSAAAFRLKGTGWYETDFKKKDNKAKPADAKAGGDKKETTATKDKTDSKSTSAESKTSASSD